MGVWVRIADAVGEALLLRRAEQRVLALAPERRTHARRLAEAARQRIEAAREIATPARTGAMILLLREGIGLLGASHRVLAGRPLEEASTVIPNPADAVGELLRERGEAPSWSQSLDTLRMTDALALDSLPRDEAQRRLRDLFDAAAWLRASMDLRTPAYVRGTRVGRIAALALLLVLIASAAWPRLAGSRSIALGKPVSMSSRGSSSAEPAKLTDGDGSSAVAIETTHEAQPWAMVDLQGISVVEQVRVQGSDNESDQTCRTIRLEISKDGTEFTRVAVPDTALPRAGRWEATLPAPAQARYVRVRSRSVCTLSLSEIEVRGRR